VRPRRERKDADRRWRVVVGAAFADRCKAVRKNSSAGSFMVLDRAEFVLLWSHTIREVYRAGGYSLSRSHAEDVVRRCEAKKFEEKRDAMLGSAQVIQRRDHTERETVPSVLCAVACLMDVISERDPLVRPDLRIRLVICLRALPLPCQAPSGVRSLIVHGLSKLVWH
jgi:hypothetical protein